MGTVLDNTSPYCCCFCNNGIESQGFDPCDLTVASNFDKEKKRHQSQWFFCHVSCFKTNMHREMQKFFVADDPTRYCYNGKCVLFDKYDTTECPHEYRCYICYQKIKSIPIDPCALNLTVNFGKEECEQYNQLFYLHAKCFKQALHEEIQQHFVLHLLEEDD